MGNPLCEKFAIKARKPLWRWVGGGVEVGGVIMDLSRWYWTVINYGLNFILDIPEAYPILEKGRKYREQKKNEPKR